MQTLNIKQYMFSDAKNISFSVNTWIVVAFTCVIIAHLAFRFKKKVQVKRSIPGLNISDISFAYLALKPVLSGKMACGVAIFQLFQAYTHFFPKEGICYVRRTFKPLVLLYKSQTVEAFLNAGNLKKGFEYELVSRVPNSIFRNNNIDKWRKHRKLIEPSFNSQILDEYCHTFSEQGILFTEKVMRLMESKQFIQIESLLKCLTLHIMCETAMGIKETNSKDKVSEYTEALSIFEKMVADRIYTPYLWPNVIYWRTQYGKEFKKVTAKMEKFVKEVILEKKTERLAQIRNNTQDNIFEFKATTMKKRTTFLNHVLNIHFQDPTFTMSDVAAEVEAFVDAGNVGAALNIGFALYLLGLYPDIQMKVHNELDEVFGEDIYSPITKDQVKELKYLDCVIKETLRLYPPAPYISRLLDEEIVINGFTIPKGTNCGIFIYELHRDPKVFPNPEVFDPDRFNNDEKWLTHGYIPFSAGPRNCIGQQFAKLEVIIVLASILRSFKVKSMLPLDKLIIGLEMTLAIKNGMHVAFHPRKSVSSNI